MFDNSCQAAARQSVQCVKRNMFRLFQQHSLLFFIFRRIPFAFLLSRYYHRIEHRHRVGRMEKLPFEYAKRCSHRIALEDKAIRSDEHRFRATNLHI